MSMSDLVTQIRQGGFVHLTPSGWRVRPMYYAPRWRDAYGQERTAKEMLTEHLWNVLAHMRANAYRNGHAETKPFYKAAVAELRRRGVI